MLPASGTPRRGGADGGAARMTQTLEPDAPAEPSAARRRAEAWLADFEAALAAGDADRAAGLFAPTSFWRDLVAFTWNITTVENPDGVADLVRNTDAGATGFRLTEEPGEDGGVVTAWFAFETGVGRGSGLLRLKEEGAPSAPEDQRRSEARRGSSGWKAWTFLTALDELKGHEENQGRSRPRGVEHGAFTDRV